MEGKIIRGIAGFYYVHVPRQGIYECKARGRFRNENVKPLVGDNVLLDIQDEAEKEGSIIQILPRRNALVRPAAANVDQAMVIFAAAQPEPNLGLLDRFLLIMGRQELPVIICFNKTDLAEPNRVGELCGIYRDCGCRVVCTSAAQGRGLDEVRELLDGRTTVMAGPSGVGKSSLTNMLYPDARMATGTISPKTQRGRHTTRHSEFFVIGSETYLIDTPGFSSIEIRDWDKEDLKCYFPEFEQYFEHCRFNGCNHISEPECAVKAAVAAGEISPRRYESYTALYRELADIRRY